MKKADAVKVTTKVETVNLKVFIHCEGCRRKVKKIINSVDGVQSITIDSNLGKVTVTGTVDSKTLVQKLQKAGKHAEPWATSAPAAGKAGNQPNQPKSANISNANNKDDFKKTAKEKVGDGGEVEKDANNGGNKGDVVNNAGGNGGGGKKGGGKKGGGGGGGEGPAVIEMSDSSAIANANRNMAQVSVQTGYSLNSEYATHMFSDENANNCHIM